MITLGINSTLKVRVVFIAIAILVSGCWPVKEEAKPSFTNSGIYSQVFSPLSSSTIVDISELAKLAVDVHSGPIAVAGYFPQKNILFAVYIGDGTLRAWDIDKATISFEHSLGISSTVGAGFDETGNLVIGALHDEIRENDFGEIEHFIGGVAVWNTETGSLARCVVFPCGKTTPSPQMQRNFISGAALDPQGQWIVSYSGLRISVEDIADIETAYSFSEGNPGNMRYIALITFDPTSGRYAIAVQEGEIIIEKIGKELTWFAPKIHLGTYKERERHEITGLSFSPDGKWLARIQDDVVSLWKVDARKGELYTEHYIPDGRLLAFNPSSELLFIGTKETIRIWDIRKMKFIGELNAPEITSLSVSADNKLLIWGDKSAILHIWGIQ